MPSLQETYDRMFPSVQIREPIAVVPLLPYADAHLILQNREGTFSRTLEIRVDATRPVAEIERKISHLLMEMGANGVGVLHTEEPRRSDLTMLIHGSALFPPDTNVEYHLIVRPAPAPAPAATVHWTGLRDMLDTGLVEGDFVGETLNASAYRRLGEVIGGEIRQQMNRASFARRILPPELVTDRPIRGISTGYTVIDEAADLQPESDQISVSREIAAEDSNIVADEDAHFIATMNQIASQPVNSGISFSSPTPQDFSEFRRRMEEEVLHPTPVLMSPSTWADLSDAVQVYDPAAQRSVTLSPGEFTTRNGDRFTIDREGNLSAYPATPIQNIDLNITVTPEGET